MQQNKGAIMNTTSPEGAKENLIDSVKSSLNDAENLLRSRRQHRRQGRRIARPRHDFAQAHPRKHLYEVQDALVERGRKAAYATDDYVHDKPWQAIGIAGLTGLLLGLLISRGVDLTVSTAGGADRPRLRRLALLLSCPYAKSLLGVASSLVELGARVSSCWRWKRPRKKAACSSCWAALSRPCCS